jgi:CrcB protein
VAKLLAVCLGGALGSGARYLVSLGALRFLGAGFPWGTLTVNVVGSFLLGVLAHLAAQELPASPAMRLLITTGFCGGFTTYSTFNNETLKLLEDGRMGLAAGYLIGTAVLCLGLGFAGVASARHLWPING